MNKEIKRLSLTLPNESDISVEFRKEFPQGITGALKIMGIGHYYYWDADEFVYRSFHMIARQLGIRVITKKCKFLSAFVVMRIE